MVHSGLQDQSDNETNHRGQLERDHEGHPERGVRRLRRLSAELLCQPVRGSPLLRCLRPHGPVRPGQRGGGRPHETSRGISQTGRVSQSSLQEGTDQTPIIAPTQVNFEDLFLAQCFKLCFLQSKEKFSRLFGKYLKDSEKKEKAELTYKIETYFD